MIAEEYGIRPFEMDDLRPMELAAILDDLDRKVAEAEKAAR